MHQNETGFKNHKKCDIDKRIRDNIIRLRQDRNLSQREFGALTGIPHIAQIETGRAGVGKLVVCKMAQALDIDVSEFYVDTYQTDPVKEIARVCSSLTRESQQYVLDTVKGLAVLEQKLKWRE